MIYSVEIEHCTYFTHFNRQKAETLVESGIASDPSLIISIDDESVGIELQDLLPTLQMPNVRYGSLRASVVRFTER